MSSILCRAAISYILPDDGPARCIFSGSVAANSGCREPTYRYFLYRPVTVVEAVPDGTSRFIHLIGLIGLILLAVFIVLLAPGWWFGVEIIRPHAVCSSRLRGSNTCPSSKT